MFRTCPTRRGLPIAAIGSVNLLTGSNAMFGTVWHGWEASTDSTNMLVRDAAGKLYIVHTWGAGYPDGDYFDLVHDQSDRRVGAGCWTVLASRPHTAEGLKELAAIAGVKTLPMATFK